MEFISIKAFIEEDEKFCEMFKSTKFFTQLPELYKHLNLSRSCYNYKWYKFKRYEVYECIDDEFLCENYLSFSAIFGETLAPAIVIDISFINGMKTRIKTNKNEIIEHLDDLPRYFDLILLLSATRYIN